VESSRAADSDVELLISDEVSDGLKLMSLRDKEEEDCHETVASETASENEQQRQQCEPCEQSCDVNNAAVDDCDTDAAIQLRAVDSLIRTDTGETEIDDISVAECDSVMSAADVDTEVAERDDEVVSSAMCDEISLMTLNNSRAERQQQWQQQDTTRDVMLDQQQTEMTTCLGDEDTEVEQSAVCDNTSVMTREISSITHSSRCEGQEVVDGAVDDRQREMTMAGGDVGTEAEMCDVMQTSVLSDNGMHEQQEQQEDVNSVSDGEHVLDKDPCSDDIVASDGGGWPSAAVGHCCLSDVEHNVVTSRQCHTSSQSHCHTEITDINCHNARSVAAPDNDSCLYSPHNNHNNNNNSSAITGAHHSGKSCAGLMCDEALAATNAERRREAMLAAMQVLRSSSEMLAMSSSAWSVEACLGRFTEQETLSGSNMITCHNCSTHIASSAADVDDTAGSTDDRSSTTTANTGTYHNHCVCSCFEVKINVLKCKE